MTPRTPAGPPARPDVVPAPDARYKDFPPGWGHLLIPTSSRAAALAGLALYAPCRRRAVAAHRLARTAVRLLGPAALPGEAGAWDSGIPDDVWPELAAEWTQSLGAFDDMAGYRRSTDRAGLSVLLLRRGAPLAFLKIRERDSGGLEWERRTLERVNAAPLREVMAPRPLAAACVRGWHYLAMTPLPPVLHHPPSRAPLERITNEIGAALAGLERAAGVPAHWRPMHGDFTPWNLRAAGDRLFLVDWEDAGWAPPGADLVLYRAVQTAMDLGRPWYGASVEAAAFWLQRVTARSPRAARDRRLTIALQRELARMAGEPAPERRA